MRQTGAKPARVVSPEEARKRALMQEAALLEAQLALRKSLPHLHGYKLYEWARRFIYSFNRLNFLTAANQVSKSSTAIRRNILLATDKTLWQEAFRGRQPRQFWYMYPSQKVMEAEFLTKWSEFLPKNKDDPQFGWRPIKKHGVLEGIHFTGSDVYLFFKFYSQSASDLQTGSVDMLTADEEMPVELWPELQARITATDGIFNMVFTATLGQDYWRRVMEPEKDEEELLPHALKIQASLYDCMYYEDGTPSHWTAEKIAEVVARCSSQAEIDRRVLGRFVVDTESKIFPAFHPGRHMIPPRPIPPSWTLITTAVDHGSGGKENHPAAITFMAVSPDMSQAEVFLGWRGDGIETAASDTAEKFVELKKSNKLTPAIQLYDQSSADLFACLSALGEGFKKSEKSHEKGEETMNSLFKNDMLKIHSTPELMKLSKELQTLRKSTPKRHRKDDLSDTVRYQVAEIVWNYAPVLARLKKTLPEPQVKQLTAEEQHLEDRRNRPVDPFIEEKNTLDAEFSEWNGLYGA